MSGRATLPGRVPGRLYDERGEEVRLRADVFNSLPYDRRPRVYDHAGMRVVRVADVRDGSVRDVGARSVAEGPRVPLAIDLLLGAVRLFVRLLTLLARLV